VRRCNDADVVACRRGDITITDVCRGTSGLFGRRVWRSGRWRASVGEDSGIDHQGLHAESFGALLDVEEFGTLGIKSACDSEGFHMNLLLYGNVQIDVYFDGCAAVWRPVR
jgi:hypothetical protein